MTESLDASLQDLGAVAVGHDGVADPALAPKPSRPPAAAAVMQIPVTIQVIIGSTRLPLAQVTELSAGSIVKLDQKLGAPCLMTVNGREIARGQLFVMGEDEQTLGLTVTEIITTGAA
jgi:flagellar motor switch protein FliN